MEFNQSFSLLAVLGEEISAAEDEHHRMLSLQPGASGVARCGRKARSRGR